MISKISFLKDFSIFHEFAWKKEIPGFKKFNLIYGWNRSGKTTISRVFASCEKKCTYDKDKFRQYPENGKFEIKTDNGTTVKNLDVATNVLPIKVFNKDFIDDNIFFDSSDSCNPIFYVSEEDIESKKRLKQLELNEITLVEAHKQAEKDKSSKEEMKSTFLTSLGREIANILFDKSYNKIKAENKINTIGIDNFSDKELSNDNKKKYEAISKSEAGKNQTALSDYQFSFSFDEKIINSFQVIFEEVEKLLGKKVVSETLDRLKDDQNLNTWVKQGFDLHKAKEEREKCLFCQKPLDKDFLDTLSKHFSKDYEGLQSAIARLKSEILIIKEVIIAVKNDELYPDLKNNYSSKAKNLNDCIEKINAWIDEAVKKLEERYDNPLVTVKNPEMPEDFLTSYNEIIAELNKIIDEHNEKVKNHASEVSNARDKLELHLISIALVDQDYKKMGTDLEEALKKKKRLLKRSIKIIPRE